MTVLYRFKPAIAVGFFHHQIFEVIWPSSQWTDVSLASDILFADFDEMTDVFTLSWFVLGFCLRWIVVGNFHWLLLKTAGREH